METAMNADGSAQAENEKFKKSIQGRLNTMKSELESLSWNLLDDDVVKSTISGLNAILAVVSHLTDAVGTLGIGLATTFAIINKNDPTKGFFKVVESVDDNGAITKKSRFKYDLPPELDTIKQATKDVDTLHGKVKALFKTMKNERRAGAQSIFDAENYQLDAKNLEKDIENMQKLARKEYELNQLDNVPLSERSGDFDIRRRMLLADMENISSETSLRALMQIEEEKKKISDFSDIDSWMESFNSRVASFEERVSQSLGNKLPGYLRTLKTQTKDLAKDYSQLIEINAQLENPALNDANKAELTAERNKVESIISGKKETYLKQAGEFSEAYYKHSSEQGHSPEEHMKLVNEQLETYVATQTSANKKLDGFKRGFKGISAETKNIFKNIGAGLAIGLAFELASKAFNKLNDEFKITSTAKIDAMEKAVSDYNDTIQETSTKTRELKSLFDEFSTLAKGVNETGENIGLTSEQFDRYHEIVNKLIADNPSLISGYDAQGRALVRQNNVIKEAIKLEERKANIAKANYLNNGEDLYNGIHTKHSKDFKAKNDSLFDIRHTLSTMSKADKESFAERYGKETRFLDAEDFIKNGNEIIDIIDVITKTSDENIAKFKDDINEFTANYDKVKNDTKDLYEWLKVYAFQDVSFGKGNKEQSLGLEGFIAPELKNSFDKYLQDLATRTDITFGLMKNKVADFGAKLVEVGTKKGFKGPIADLRKAQLELSRSDYGSAAINKYNNAVKNASSELRNFAASQKGNSEVVQELKDALYDVSDSYVNFLDNLSVEAVLNIDDTGLESARGQLEQFQQSAGKEDYSTAIRNYKTIYETITDRVGDDGREFRDGQGSIHSAGKGDQTFWDGAERILGEKKLKELGYDAKEVVKAMDKYKTAFEGGRKATKLLFDELSNDEALKDINEILGYDALSKNNKGNLELDYIDASRFGEIADYLGISEELFVSLLDNARQFTEISFTNIKELAYAIGKSEKTVTFGKGDKAKKYSSYSEFETTAKQQGYTSDKVAEMSDQLKKEDIILVDSDKLNTVNSFLKSYQAESKKNIFDTKDKTKISDPEEYIKALSNVLNPEEIVNAWRTAESKDYKFNINKKDIEKYDASGNKALEGQELANYIQDHLHKDVPEGEEEEEEITDPIDAIDNQTQILAGKLDQLIVAAGGDIVLKKNGDEEKAIKKGEKASTDLLGDGKSKKGNIENETARKNLQNSIRELQLRKEQIENAYLAQENGEYEKEKAENTEGTALYELNHKLEKLKENELTVTLATKMKDNPDGSSDIIKLLTDKGVDASKVVDIITEFNSNGDTEEYQKMLTSLPKEVRTLVETIVKGEGKLKLVDNKLYEIDGKNAKCVFSADTSDYDKKYKWINKKLYEYKDGVYTCVMGADDKDFKKKYKFVDGKLEEIKEKEVNPKVGADDTKYKKKEKGVKTGLKKLNKSKAVPDIEANKKKFDETHKVVNGKLCHLVDHKWVPVVDAHVGNSEQKIGKVKKKLDNIPAEKDVSIVAKFKGFAGAAWTYVKKKLGISDSVANGTPGRISPSYAFGTQKCISPSYAFGKKNFGAKGGLSLTGELGPELIWSGDRSYIVGERGPEMINLKPGDVVYTADETKRILAGRNYHPTFNSHAGGVGGTIRQEDLKDDDDQVRVTVTHKKKKTHKNKNNRNNRNNRTNKNNRNNRTNKTNKNNSTEVVISKASQKKLDAYTKGKDRLDHLLKMGYISEKTYYTRLKKLYNKYLKNVKDLLKERRQGQEDLKDHLYACYEAEKSQLQHLLNMNIISQKTYHKKLVALNKKYLKNNKMFKQEYKQALEEQAQAYIAAYEEEKNQLQHLLNMNIISQETYYRRLVALDNRYLKDKKQFKKEYRQALEEEVQAYVETYNKKKSYLDYIHNLGIIDDEAYLARHRYERKKKFPTLGKGKYKQASREAWEEEVGLARDIYTKMIDDLTKDYNDGKLTNEAYRDAVVELGNKVIFKPYKENLKEQTEEAIKEALDNVASKLENDFSDVQQLISDKDLFGAWDNGETPITLLQNQIKLVNEAYAKGLISGEKYKDIILEIERAIKEAEKNDFGKQKDNLNDMVELVERLVRQEAQDQIDALNKQSEVYEKIIDQKRKALALTQKELSFQESMEDIAKQIAEKQGEIDLLSRDTSREGKAKLVTAQKELEELLKNQEHSLRDETVDRINQRYDKQSTQHSELIARYVKSISDWLDDKAAVLDKVFEEIENRELNDLLVRLFEYNRKYGDADDNTVTNYWENLEKVLSGNNDTVKNIYFELKKLTSENNLHNGRLPVPDQAIPKRHNGLSGGYVGANVTPKMNETYALLTRDELVLNRKDQNLLASKLKNGEAYKDLMASIFKDNNISHNATNQNNQKTDIKIENNIQINSNGDLPADIDKIGEQLSNKTLSKLQSALQINGIQPNISINTYNRK